MFWTDLTHWLTYWLTQKHNSGFLCTDRFGFREQLLTIRLTIRLSFDSKRFPEMDYDTD